MPFIKTKIKVDYHSMYNQRFSDSIVVINELKVIEY
ncbi:hypothetical protein Emtol_3403 [Emticicia oligotrophica DSM 17448]|uniref:Uncharacterized protein n=2 Tax=Emticicia TaxID=312278 RepID=A0ABM5N586_EMTOG|nr:hypothetical protein Emtol_3403 [Emticicia oligotrophica DSM 17448]